MICQLSYDSTKKTFLLVGEKARKKRRHINVWLHKLKTANSQRAVTQPEMGTVVLEEHSSWRLFLLGMG